MFCRAIRHARPLATRAMSSKRNLPIRTPWGSGNSLWSDFSREPRFPFPMRDFRDIERQFEDMWRQMDRMITPRFFDAYYLRPREAEAVSRTEVAQLKYDKEGFELKLDVQQYSPEELNVKLAGNRLIVSGKHEQKADEHGFVKREFHREIEVPEDVDLDTMSSSVSAEGILTIRATVKGSEKPPEKTIEIKAEPKVESKSDEHKND